MSTALSNKVSQSIRVAPPAKWKVIYHNDDRTTFDFVITSLRSIYGKSFEEAIEITERVHKTGLAVVGVYTKEIAMEKQKETLNFAAAFNFPLKVTCESE